MKKIVISVLLVTGLLAVDNQDYIGIAIGNAKLTAKTTVPDLFVRGDVDNTQYTATLGHYYDDTGRVHATFTYVNPSGSVDTESALSVGYDYLLPVTTNQFSLYAGPVIGYTWYKESAGTLNLDVSDFHYGAQAGAIAKITNNFELEAGYRYLIETGNDAKSGVNLDAENLKIWYIGVNLHFNQSS